MVLQGVGSRFQRYFDRDWESAETPRTELVVIGKSGMDRDAIAAMIG
jgi:cobalamin biosynthesis protein CobW